MPRSVQSDPVVREGTLPAEPADGRIDQLLTVALPDLSRERIKTLVRAGHLTVHRKTVSAPSARGHAGAAFSLAVPVPAPAAAQGEAIALDVVHEDDDLIVIDKAAGMVVHPAAGHRSGTLVNALLHHCAGSLSGVGGVERPGIVHRIDKDTSGLIVAAKTDIAHRGLAEQFAAHSVERRYKAIVHGRPRPASGTVEARIGRNPRNRKSMAVVGEGRGKHALTHYSTTCLLDEATLVECRLETGRTHQVRVHMSHIGHPLVGDPLYQPRRKRALLAAKDIRFGRQALHAATLGFVHPASGENLSFRSEFPADIKELFSRLRVD